MEGIGASLLDAAGFLIVAAVLGSFTFWLFGYFVYEALKSAFRGPSEQEKSLGTSILSEPAYASRSMSTLPMVTPLALEQQPSGKPKAA